MLQGIRYRRISFYGFMIGSALAAISGGLIAPLVAISPSACGNAYSSPRHPSSSSSAAWEAYQAQSWAGS